MLTQHEREVLHECGVYCTQFEDEHILEFVEWALIDICDTEEAQAEYDADMAELCSPFANEVERLRCHH